MKTLNRKLNILREKLKERKARIMIIGLGSVGNYLLDYLMSMADEEIEICVVGRNANKMESDVNIIKVASLIRNQNKSNVSVISGVNLNDIQSVASVINSYKPDIIVNSSRAYPGLKYGSISWKSIRAYGIWTPLAIRYTKNIMEAYEIVHSDAIVINTSYSDAVIPWLKSAGKAYPDFGSGNINHLVPRIQMAAAAENGISDYWNIDVTFAVSHFHDVVISKEGQTEGTEMLLDIRYKRKKLCSDINKVILGCAIVMPVDVKRNQMNASSNFAIIQAVLSAVRGRTRTKLHCPGVFGKIGGYPVIIDGTKDNMTTYICEDYFTEEEMVNKNRESIYLDGIQDIRDGVLIYTDELLVKVKKAFGVELMKKVSFDEIESAADFIIKEIIEKNV